MNPALMRKKLSPPEYIVGEWFWRYYEWNSCRFGPVCVLQTLLVLLVCVLNENEVISTLPLFTKKLLCTFLAYSDFYLLILFSCIFFSIPYLWLIKDAFLRLAPLPILHVSITFLYLMKPHVVHLYRFCFNWTKIFNKSIIIGLISRVMFLACQKTV